METGAAEGGSGLRAFAGFGLRASQRGRWRQASGGK